LPRVRAELEEANFVSSRDIDKLLSLPLLQSIYAEVMRLRTEVQHVLYSKNDDIQINEWRFPKQHIVLVPSGAAHRNENFWNTMDGQHPLNRFWADRFLVYPNDPRSGPLKKATKVPALETANCGTPKYKESGMSDAFIPYGVGERACPGRFFARREVIGFCATIVANYDVELLTTERHFENGPEFYGLGTTGPLKSIPFRVRRRSKIGSGLP
jgi:cytochrome P450